MNMVVTIRKVNRWEQADELQIPIGSALIAVDDNSVTKNADFFEAVNLAKSEGASHYKLKLLLPNGSERVFSVDCSKPLGVELYESTGDTLEKVKASAIIVTTASSLHAAEIGKELGVISAEVAYGMNIFKDFFKSVRDLVGGRSKAVENTLKDAKSAALIDLKFEAHKLGAQAVIGVDFEISSIGDNQMLIVTAYGTAVTTK